MPFCTPHTCTCLSPVPSACNALAEVVTFHLRLFPPQPEEKQKASVAFAQLRAAMATLGITAEEQAAVWRVLAGIYHLGAAGACKGMGAPASPCSLSQCRG